MPIRRSDRARAKARGRQQRAAEAAAAAAAAEAACEELEVPPGAGFEDVYEAIVALEERGGRLRRLVLPPTVHYHNLRQAQKVPPRTWLVLVADVLIPGGEVYIGFSPQLASLSMETLDLAWVAGMKPSDRWARELLEARTHFLVALEGPAHMRIARITDPAGFYEPGVNSAVSTVCQLFRTDHGERLVRKLERLEVRGDPAFVREMLLVLASLGVTATQLEVAGPCSGGKTYSNLIFRAAAKLLVGERTVRWRAAGPPADLAADRLAARLHGLTPL